MNILNKEIVLVLNKNWQPVNIVTPVQAFNQLFAGAATPLHVDDDKILGPVKLDDWLELPVNNTEWYINTPHKKVRIPVVIILCNFDQVPKKRIKFSRRSVFERDGGIDQYTGEKVPFEHGNLDHVIPRAQGGETDWENIVWTAKETNSKKRDRTPEQAGLKLLKKPKKPTVEIPVIKRIKNKPGIKAWDPFLLPENRSDKVKHNDRA